MESNNRATDAHAQHRQALSIISRTTGAELAAETLHCPECGMHDAIAPRPDRPVAAFGLIFDHDMLCVRIGGPAGMPIETMTPTERRIAEVLLEWPGRVVATETILRRAFGPEYASDPETILTYAHMVRVNISRLRLKIAPYVAADNTGKMLMRRALAARMNVGYYIVRADDRWLFGSRDVLMRMMLLTQLLMPGVGGLLDPRDAKRAGGISELPAGSYIEGTATEVTP